MTITTDGYEVIQRLEHEARLAEENGNGYVTLPMQVVTKVIAVIDGLCVSLSATETEIHETRLAHERLLEAVRPVTAVES